MTLGVISERAVAEADPQSGVVEPGAHLGKHFAPDLVRVEGTRPLPEIPEPRDDGVAVLGAAAIVEANAMRDRDVADGLERRGQPPGAERRGEPAREKLPSRFGI